MSRPVFDTYTYEGAERLCQAIRDYWAHRGKIPLVLVRKLMLPSSPSAAPRSVFIIESNMVGGKPQ